MIAARLSGWFTGAALAAIAVAGAPMIAGCASTDGVSAAAAPAANPTLLGMRRLNASQYKHSIADIFSDEIAVTGRFEPEIRTEGLNAIGAGTGSISAAGFEQYYAMASGIAGQVLGEEGRASFMPCSPASETAPDDACASAFVSQYGHKLFRRPLTTAEVRERVDLARSVGAEREDFYSGLGEALISLLVAPDFLFRIERTTEDGDRLDAQTRASRLSYLLWDTTPDDELLAAAESGALMTEGGLAAQVDRMVSSTRLTDGVAAFFDDMLQLDKLERLSKDPQTHPKYGGAISVAAREQTIRTVIDHLVTDGGDYRDLFTTRDTFMTRELAVVYSVPFGRRDGWSDYTFAPETQRVGLQTQISFLSLFAHPARSSPTKRGVALNEIFLCTVTPEPPPDVDFTIINEGGPTLRSLRARLEAHVTDPVCAGCHELSDAPGLALEHFDGLGEHRETDNGEPINDNVVWFGEAINGPEGLGQLLHDDPRTTECLVRNLYSTAQGREIDYEEAAVLAELEDNFATGNYRFPELLRAVALNPNLYRVKGAETAPDTRLAAHIQTGQEIR